MIQPVEEEEKKNESIISELPAEITDFDEDETDESVSNTRYPRSSKFNQNYDVFAPGQII